MADDRGSTSLLGLECKIIVLIEILNWLRPFRTLVLCHYAFAPMGWILRDISNYATTQVLSTDHMPKYQAVQ